LTVGLRMDTEHGAITEPVRRLEVFTGAGRRRTWRDQDKARIVAEIATRLARFQLTLLCSPYPAEARIPESAPGNSLPRLNCSTDRSSGRQNEIQDYENRDGSGGTDYEFLSEV
jgi:hypothetical protein